MLKKGRLNSRLLSHTDGSFRGILKTRAPYWARSEVETGVEYFNRYSTIIGKLFFKEMLRNIIEKYK